MKKILKNKFFIIIFIMILCISGTLYAETNHQASEIIYNPSDGSNSKAVNEVLKELYDSQNQYNDNDQCSEGTLCKKVNIGDYVSMTPTETTYTILSSLTGYDSDQTINPSELNLWRVIKINGDGTIEMVSEYVSSTKVYFKGQTGYLNLVGVLNNIARQYGNSSYTIKARIMGYRGQTATITDTSKFTNPAPWTSSTSDNSNETLGGGDVMYEYDTNLVTEALGTLAAKNPSGTATSYWLGSRLYYYSGSTHYSWDGFNVYSSGYIGSNYLYRYNSDWNSNTNSYAIRPILTLKSGITATGSGTSGDPWVLE